MRPEAAAYMVVLDDDSLGYPAGLALAPGADLPPEGRRVYRVKVRDRRDPGTQRLMSVGWTTGRETRTSQWSWPTREAEVEYDMLLAHDERLLLPTGSVPPVPLREGMAVVPIGASQDEALYAAWAAHPPVIRNDAMSLPPVNAWLVVGTEESLPTAGEVEDSWVLPMDSWTVPKHVQRGDLLFLYFMAPRKAIHFAARVAADPIFDPGRDSEVRPWARNQHWADYARLVPTGPVAYETLKDLHGGHLNLRGRAGQYLRPDVVRKIIDHAAAEGAPGREVTLQTPVGSADLPDPATMSFTDWTRIADGELAYRTGDGPRRSAPEKNVELYIAEPLLRLAVGDRADVTRQHRIPKVGIPDYLVTDQAGPRAVVEVKVGVRQSRTHGLRDSPDLAQVLRYARALDVPAALVDSGRIFLIPRGAGDPETVIRRRDATMDDLAAISRHLLS